MKPLKITLLELLNIQGVSGREQQVAAYVTERLTRHQFTVVRDRYGNVLAERRFGALDKGPVLLLSAHMDTVLPFVPGRQIVWDGDILRSSEGILGADDRAGIAIVLEVIERMESHPYYGTLKIAFTRDEERGRVGSNEIPAEWLADVDMAVVADRRNRRDIVTSCRYMSFCSDKVGEYWERVGEQIGQPDWKSCQGGISDAMTYAEHGIPSINVSCGYQHEHTEWEELHWPSVMDTVKLISEGVLTWRQVTSPVR
ncbi:MULTISPECIES: M20/M25/M40 family metallo-hydrolase [unclassified Paenibacillus]|uniref:M20/M25/M40 family metallo-hydrolase n=1 Tax=unclassified Paenibacillus TaxID=185978 RepID=UPI001AE669BA|nr:MULTISPECIES: M20/M25/M40 family metallo-hydrolase [unclassified Paenibacillus]MBP1154022.1 putative aminopeptidase FrvX [Paenibacillus sp. PvP091]MBP1170593.1 putative aminopeptidase FrvX [Paenibacillus sp. PvR098]MBP2441621.1 putative aminopeptidase FrvX [Paenibacillus sp. PvP052]